MMKKFISFLLAAVMLLSLAACSTQTEKDNKETSAPESPSSLEEGTGDAGAVKKISVAHWMLTSSFPSAQAYMENVEAIFKDSYPDVEIEWNPIPSESGKYHDLLKAQLATNSAPDVFFHQNAIVQFGKADYLTDLSDQEWAGRILESTVTDVVYEGKLLGIPVDVAGWGVFYNQEVFDTYDLSVPTTFDELLAVCGTLKENGVTPFNMGFKDSWTQDGPWLSMSSFIYGMDKNFPQELYDGIKQINSEEFTGMFEAFEELVSNGYISNSIMSTTYDQAAQEFGEGQVAMQINGPWCVQQIYDQYGVDVGYFNIPDREGNVYMTTITNSTVSLNSKFEDKEMGFTMLKALTDESSLQILLKDSGYCGLKDIEIEQTLAGGKAYGDALVNDKAAMQTNVWIPASAGQKLTQLTTLICSGKPFDAAYLEAADDAYQKDKDLLNMQ